VAPDWGRSRPPVLSSLGGLLFSLRTFSAAASVFAETGASSVQRTIAPPDGALSVASLILLPATTTPAALPTSASGLSSAGPPLADKRPAHPELRPSLRGISSTLTRAFFEDSPPGTFASRAVEIAASSSILPLRGLT